MYIVKFASLFNLLLAINAELIYLFKFVEYGQAYFILFQLRIEAHGGYVHREDSGRCLVNDRLAMSRSLGDLELKAHGVIATPDVMSIEV